MTWTPDDALVEKAARAWQAATELGRTPTFDSAVVMVDPHQAMRAALIAAYPDMVAEAVRDLARLVAEGLDLCAQARAIDAALENTTKPTPILWATEHYHKELAAWESRASLAIRARHP